MALEQDYAACAQIVREHDRDRFLTSLFAPPDIRPHLHALYAFDIEVARVAAMVSEPMPGEIRLQWWRDGLSGIAHGDLAGAPVLAALQATLSQYGLPPDPLIRLTEARIFDLYDDRMPDMGALETYAGETDSAILQLAATVSTGQAVPEVADVSGHGGVAMTILRGLKRLAASEGRDKRLVPTATSEQHGQVSDVSPEAPMPELSAIWADMIAVARDHLLKAKAALAACAPQTDAAFLPLSLLPRDLRRLQKQGPIPAAAGEDNAFLRQWHLWRVARAGGLRGVRL